MTSYPDCERDLISHGGEGQVASWKPSDEVKAVTWAFQHDYWHEVTVAEVLRVIQANRAKLHPLGRIKAEAAIREVDDLGPDFPLVHMFHLCMEELRRVPAWSEFWSFFTSPAQRARCHDHFERLLAELPAEYTEQRKREAVQWRIGNAYNSCLRELWVAAWLREKAGLSPRYHLFADAQMQVDMWFGKTIVCIRVRSGKLGRKPSPARWARQFHIVNIDIGHGGFGELWLPTEEQMKTLVALPPEAGAITTIYPDSTVTVERTRGAVSAVSGGATPLRVPPAMPADQVAAALQPDDEVPAALQIPAQPRYSLTLVTQAPIAPEPVRTLLRAGVKVVLFHPDPPDWPALTSFKKARLLQVLPLPASLRPAVTTPCAVIDGQAGPGALDLLTRLGEAVTNFNFEQWRVEHASPDSHLQVAAGAGTGKTAVMKDRVMFLLHVVSGLSPREITMITFTREATRVMRERLRRELEMRFRLTGDARYLQWLEDLSFMQVSTIPSFARRLLQSVGSLLGYGQNFRIREFGRERQSLLSRILDERLASARVGRRLQDLLRVPLYRFVDVANRYWQEMENKGLGPGEIGQLDWGMASEPTSRVLQQLWGDLFTEAERRLQAEKERSNSISLSDLTRQVQLLGAHMSALSRTGLSIKYMFIDEFQDSDDTQIRLAAALQKELGARIFVVGDIKQSVYRFRGATYTAFEALSRRLAEHGEQMEEFSLRKNYRTATAVLAQMAPYFAQWGASGWLPYKSSDQLVGVVDKPGEFRIASSDSKEDSQALRELVMGWIREARDTVRIDPETGEPERVAVLVRTNEQAALIRAWCDADPTGVFCQVDRGGTLFASQAAHDFHALVSGLLYPREPMAMLNLLATPFSAVRIPWPALLPLKGDRAKLEAFLAGHLPHAGKWQELLDKRRTEPVLSLLRTAIREMQPVQRYFDQELAALTRQFPAKDEAELRQEAGARAAQYQLNLDRIMELTHSAFSEQFATLYGVHAWLELQQSTNRTESEPPLPAEAQNGRILCVTVHRSKGDEFHTVIVPFTYKRFRVPGNELLLDERQGRWSAGWMLQVRGDDGWVRYRNDHHRRLEGAEANEAFLEETRLLYVALTRTQRRLWVVQYAKGNENWGRLLRLDQKEEE